MNKVEIIKGLAEKTGMSQKATKEVFEAFETVVADAVKVDGVAKLGMIGTLTKKHVDACERRNPATGETFMAEAKEKVTYKAPTALKEYINA